MGINIKRISWGSRDEWKNVWLGTGVNPRGDQGRGKFRKKTFEGAKHQLEKQIKLYIVIVLCLVYSYYNFFLTYINHSSLQLQFSILKYDENE